MDARMMYLHAISPVHTGTGQAVDVIDLPVAREATTGWPYLPGSSIRGVLRSLCRPNGDGTPEKDLFARAFGPETVRADADDAAGALLFGDGRLLCLPVRSLFGTFAWVSCPLALDRYRRDHEAAALAPPPAVDLSRLAAGAIALAEGARVADDGTVYLEDLDLPAARAVSTAGVTGLARAIAGAVFDDDPWRDHFVARFGVVDDTTFSFLAETATEVTARIRLEEETKTVREGALWYEEAIPTETIFSTPLLAAPRNGAHADPLFRLIAAHLGGMVQLGGHAGVGRGLMRLRLREGA